MLEQQLQTFLQSLNIADLASTADDLTYYQFLTRAPHQAAAHIDWAADYQQHHIDSGQKSPQHSLPEQQAREEAWGTARQAPGLKPLPHQLHPGTAWGSEWADAFHQSDDAAPQSWAEDFSRLHLEEASSQQTAPARPSAHPSWVSDFQSQRQHHQATDQPWAEQFLAGDEEQWAEQFATEQQEEAQQRQLTPEEQKAVRGPQPDDPLDDKAALSWVRQFNEEAAKPSVNFGMLAVLDPWLHYTLQRHFAVRAEQGCHLVWEFAFDNDSPAP